MLRLENCARGHTHREGSVQRERPPGRCASRFAPPEDGEQLGSASHAAIVVVRAPESIVRYDDIAYIRGMTAEAKISRIR
jgi:hypothetical protein